MIPEFTLTEYCEKMEWRVPDYLGDGLYAAWDASGQLWLFTCDGFRVTNRVALEPGVLCNLHEYLNRTEAE